MKKLTFVSTLLITLATLSSCTEKGPSFSEYWKTWGDQQLADWALNAEELHTSVIDYCSTGNNSLEQVQTRWKTLAINWARMNGLPYHAITDLNLSFELYSWPDKRNMTEVRLSARIKQAAISVDASAKLSAESLKSATASEKGLLALEWLSFEPDLTQEQRCNALPAISDDYKNNISAIVSYHQDHPLVLDEWLQSVNGIDSHEGQSIALNLLFQQAVQISNRLRTSINEDGKIIPIVSEGWRANLTLEIYLSSVRSLVDHLTVLSHRAAITVNSIGLVEDQRTQLVDLVHDMTQTTPGEPPNTSLNWKALQQAIIDTENLIEGPIAEDLDILIGFNNYDGD